MAPGLTFQKLICIFAKRPALRFLSHHDLMRTFHRALRRAGLAVRQTQGYNPRPRVVFPHALELGISSEDEAVEIELKRWVPPSQFARRLERALPEGLDVREVRLMPPRRRGSKALEAHYEAELSPEQAAAARSGVERFMSSESWPIERVDHRVASGTFSEVTRRGRVASGTFSKVTRRGRVASGSARKDTRRDKGSSRQIDLRPHVLALSVAGEGATLRMSLKLGAPGAARPREVLAAVLGAPAEAMLDVPLRKTKTVLAGPV